MLELHAPVVRSAGGKRGAVPPALSTTLHDAIRTGFEGAPSASPWASIRLKHVDTVGQRPEDDVAPVEHRRILQSDKKLRRHLVRPRAHHDQ